jgi:low temperature requirement protein LtrA
VKNSETQVWKVFLSLCIFIAIMFLTQIIEHGAEMGLDEYVLVERMILCGVAALYFARRENKNISIGVKTFTILLGLLMVDEVFPLLYNFIKIFY